MKNIIYLVAENFIFMMKTVNIQGVLQLRNSLKSKAYFENGSRFTAELDAVYYLSHKAVEFYEIGDIEKYQSYCRVALHILKEYVSVELYVELIK
jgi:hypothetical protein